MHCLKSRKAIGSPKTFPGGRTPARPQTCSPCSRITASIWSASVPPPLRRTDTLTLTEAARSRQPARQRLLCRNRFCRSGSRQARQATRFVGRAHPLLRWRLFTGHPGAWSSSNLAQLESSVYSYVKSEIESYRAAGVMPDHGLNRQRSRHRILRLSRLAPSSNFTNFAAVEQQAHAGRSRCIVRHLARSRLPAPAALHPHHPCVGSDQVSSPKRRPTRSPSMPSARATIPCTTGPLTAAQAAASNPSNQPVEQTVLTNAANSIGVPIFLIEVGGTLRKRLRFERSLVSGHRRGPAPVSHRPQQRSKGCPIISAWAWNTGTRKA